MLLYCTSYCVISSCIIPYLQLLFTLQIKVNHTKNYIIVDKHFIDPCTIVQYIKQTKQI